VIRASWYPLCSDFGKRLQSPLKSFHFGRRLQPLLEGLHFQRPLQPLLEGSPDQPACRSDWGDDSDQDTALAHLLARAEEARVYLSRAKTLLEQEPRNDTALGCAYIRCAERIREMLNAQLRHLDSTAELFLKLQDAEQELRSIAAMASQRASERPFGANTNVPRATDMLAGSVLCWAKATGDPSVG
jgi:hypothetical protein